MGRKILFKRGLRKDLPTLSPGEMALTTDTKETFIGNEDGNNLRIMNENDVNNFATSDKLGDLSQLKTSNKSSLTAATNEINTSLSDTMNFLSEVGVNVKKWGAKGDGLTDDAPAIRNAIAYLRGKGGGTLYFPDPKVSYLLSSFDPLTSYPSINFWINFSNLTITGQNKSTIKVANGKLGEAIFGNFYTKTVSNIKVDNIAFDFNGANNLATSGNRASKAAFLSYWCNGLEIKNCKFIDASGEHCIYVGRPDDQNNGQNIRIHDNEFYNVGDSVSGNTNNTDHSSIFATGKNIWIYNNKFVNPNQSRRATAIEAEGSNIYQYDNYIEKYNLPFLTANLTGSWTGPASTTTKNIVVDNVHIHSNTVKSCLDGWWVENKTAGGFKNVKFYNNIIELHDAVGNGTRYCVRGGAAILFPIENIDIYNNSFSSDGDYTTLSGTTLGIQIDAAKNLSIKDNKIFNLAGFAIRLKSVTLGTTSVDTDISGNKIYDVCSNSLEGFVKAISIQGASNRLKIVNNKIDNVKYTGCTTGIELFAGDSGTYVYNDVLIQDNQIHIANTDIETWTINLTNSDKILIYHKSYNANFDVLNQVSCSKGSLIEKTKLEIKYIKSDTWKTHDLGASPPTSGQRYQNDYRTNTNKTELGTSPNKYIIKGWECIVSGNPGTWREERALTGN